MGDDGINPPVADDDPDMDPLTEPRLPPTRPDRLGERLAALKAELERWIHRRARGDRADAEDAVQEILTSALRTDTAVELADETLRQWAYGAARNQVSNIHRTRGRSATRSEQVERLGGLGAPDRDDADLRLDRERLRSRDLPQGLAALRAEHPSWASIVELRLTADMTFEEIATELGIPANTARGRYGRGEAFLREWLGRRQRRTAMLAWLPAFLRSRTHGHNAITRGGRPSPAPPRGPWPWAAAASGVAVVALLVWWPLRSTSQLPAAGPDPDRSSVAPVDRSIAPAAAPPAMPTPPPDALRRSAAPRAETAAPRAETAAPRAETPTPRQAAPPAAVRPDGTPVAPSAIAPAPPTAPAPAAPSDGYEAYQRARSLLESARTTETRAGQTAARTDWEEAASAYDALLPHASGALARLAQTDRAEIAVRLGAPDAGRRLRDLLGTEADDRGRRALLDMLALAEAASGRCESLRSVPDGQGGAERASPALVAACRRTQSARSRP